MKNPRKGKSLYSLWLSEEEEKFFIDGLESNRIVLMATILKRAYKRGDLEKR